MELNVLVRGQSNAILMMEAGNWAGSGAITQEVQRLLGFDGTTDRVNLIYDRYDLNSSTAFGGTGLIGDWLTARNGDWRQGWDIAQYERALLNEIAGLPATQRDDPTAVLWLHSEYDSANRDLTTDMWVSAVRFDAAQTRAAFGQSASTVPYLFISAMPYYGTTEGHNAIREGMERLVADGSFNARTAARMIDVDTDGDSAGQYGGGHIDAEDAMQTVMRSARAIAETFAAYAKPGSPVALAGGDIADDGPQVIRAVPVASNQLRIDVQHDKAGGFRALDADAARGVGWSVHAPGVEVTGTAARIEDADSLVVTFSGTVPTGGMLHYGHGYGRLAGADGSGRGNAVYDDQGLPIWTPAVGVALSGGGTAPPPVTSPTPTPTPEPAPSPAPAPAPAPAAGQTVNGTAGADNLRGGAGADTLNGLDGSDDLQSFDGNDRLAGGRGHDGLTLGAGADTVVFARGDADDWVVDFTPGTDRVLVQGYNASEATFRGATYWGMAGTDLVLANGDRIFFQGATNVTASNVTFEGGQTVAPAPAPTPEPTPAPAPAPAPAPSPAAGVTVNGTSGGDDLRGGAGADTLNGLDGSDDLQSFDGNDRLAGGRGHDGLTLGAGADTVVFARGDADDWVVDFAPGTDRVLVQGYNAAEATFRGATYWGMSGTDLVLANGDRIFFQGATNVTASNVTFEGGTAPAPAPAPVAGVTRNGTSGADTLRGDGGADTLSGAAGNDVLQGLAGDDLLRGGRGRDTLTGGAGGDSLAFARGDGADWVVDFASGADRIRLEGITASQVTQTVETRSGTTGLKLAFGNGDEMFLQGVTARLPAADLVFA